MIDQLLVLVGVIAIVVGYIIFMECLSGGIEDL